MKGAHLKTLSLMALSTACASYSVALKDVVAARDRIRPFGIGETPIHQSEIMNSLSGHDV
jgi:hypothetical protein